MNSSTSTNEIQDRIRAVLRRTIGDPVDGLPPDTDLATALGDRYDSLTALECIVAIESAFGIEVDFVAQDVRYWFATIDRMTTFVRDQLEDRASLGSAG
ncbi:acyl carrier protein [Rhizomonospora bruguierae]|uniref:acyl carrier protein n=1 Tax=Rhizomonospora bruguierae TaxID=1581705 RepID=UPI001BCC7F59|nr:acyl carrier protein [Micromonospora sp. NBRC 107566]